MTAVNAPAYAELAVTSNFSFLHGGSHPHEMVGMAKELGLSAIGIADRNTLSGAVRAHVAARDAGIRLVVGARLVLRDGFEALCFPTDREAYGRLSKLLTLGNLRAPKGECHLDFEDLAGLGHGQRFVVMPTYELDGEFRERLARFACVFAGETYLALTPYYRSNDRARFDRLAALADQHGTPLLATNDVLYHDHGRRRLQDLLTCIREHVTIDEAGFRLERNAERHLKSGAEMARLLSGYEAALARTIELSEVCTFSLSELKPHYPDEPMGESATPQAELERLTWEGARRRFPNGISENVRGKIAHELRLIAELDFAPYFLTVQDIVGFARSQHILCQGRGSSANSVVCYCLGITAVNPDEIDLLFERFISVERGEPPDIDVDFEHERREEVIQYIYKKYGRHRAGIAATVISYRARSAINEAGKAMGLSPDIVRAMSGIVWGWSSETPPQDDIRKAGLDPHDPRLLQALVLAGELVGFPRHLSQHVGGFVITQEPLEEVVPIGNAGMDERTFVEWDKDDLDALGLLKVDVLALGMLTCLRKTFDLVADHYGTRYSLASVPREDKATYAMIQEADTVGVFQIESRAQMSMLPRLRPKDFYDLVIEIAIVRPGPIQGDMVHPYLRRRQGRETVEYPSEALKAVLHKTLGVPLFQEQAMKIAMVGAGFSADKADKLRRAMASFRNHGTIDKFRDDFIKGMTGKGYKLDFAQRCFKQIEGFSDYGFPESHSASFALLAYASAWLKCHFPDAFACALLNSQPMGFYSSGSIVRDFRDHHGVVLPVDVNHSDWDHKLEPLEDPRAMTREGGNAFALRLGLRQIDGMREETGQKLVAARGAGFADMNDLYERTRIEVSVLQRLAHADAYRSFGLDRRQALWEIRGLSGYLGARANEESLPLFLNEDAGVSALLPTEDEKVELPALLDGEHVHQDYETLRLSLKGHPVAFLRDRLDPRGVVRTRDLEGVTNGRKVIIAGLVLVRQRPGTASGVVFMTLEDETGIANAVIWKTVFDEFRKVVMGARMVAIEGTVQKADNVTHVVAKRLIDLTPQLMRAMETAPDRAKPPVEQPSLWRHPRDTRVLPKGRNFH
ncbi:error-prone DNA polymerase [Devosia nitrariae]|uniref:Error-prone DNA polymerase n=1 Tax=Devosia nitrariae TaxID=2071872 RepID=A0ABQ5WBX6_9HYPH|nr:error-prone DNA polymerase [Devosia nitrariae]GLQ57106.1 error-prone DNA polymerase [Devosia nitrariae]